MALKHHVAQNQQMQNEYDALTQQIAANIRKKRNKMKFTQEQMQDFGFDYRHYQRLEAGSVVPSLNTLFRLSKAFNCKIQEFFKK